MLENRSHFAGESLNIAGEVFTHRIQFIAVKKLPTGFRSREDPQFYLFEPEKNTASTEFSPHLDNLLNLIYDDCFEQYFKWLVVACYMACKLINNIIIIIIILVFYY